MSAEAIAEREFAQRVLRMLNLELVRDQEQVARAQLLSQATVRGTAETHTLQQRGATPRPATISTAQVTTCPRADDSCGSPDRAVGPILPRLDLPPLTPVVQGTHHPQPGVHP